MYQFTEDCKIGIRTIDEEHERLFGLINQTMELSKNGKETYDVMRGVLAELHCYALNHFAHEEDYMERFHDRELERQKKEHRFFREKIDSYKLETLSEEDLEKVVRDVLEFMAKWLYRHILGSDIMIGKFTVDPMEDIFTFSNDYHTGIEFIDEEHKKLFEIIEEANDTIHAELLHDKYDAIVHIIEELKEYTIQHFTDEEAYMVKIGYEGLEMQRMAHAAFVERLESIDLAVLDDNQTKYLDDLVAFLLEWLVGHIKHMDKKIPKEAKAV